MAGIAAAKSAYVALGANLGDPPQQLRRALQALSVVPGIRLDACSSFYRSAPVGVPGQPDYCNAVCALTISLTPEALLAVLQTIERDGGRVRDGTRWGARHLDLDLLHVDGERRQNRGLTLPHPEIANRNWVLIPWQEIAPELIIPGIGSIATKALELGSAGLAPWP